MNASCDVALVFFLTLLALGGSGKEHHIKLQGSRIPQSLNRTSRIAFATDGSSVHQLTEDLRPRLNSKGLPGCKLRIFGSSAYCEDHDSYPTQKVQQLMENLNLSLGDPRPPRAEPRHGISGPLDLCSYKVVDIRPKVALSTKKEWLFVVNGFEREQLVTMELCTNTGEECSHLHDGRPYGYSTVCVQRMSTRWLLAVDPHGREAVSDEFEFPSCCVCHLVRQR